MWLHINNIHKKTYMWFQPKILTARAFLVHSTDWLKQTTTFVKFKLFQDQRFKYHSAENVEMCKDRFYTSLLQITSFTITSKSWCFLNHQSSIMKARHLDTTSISLLLFWNQENASSSQRWKTVLRCLMTVQHCLFPRPHHGWIREEIFEI